MLWKDKDIRITLDTHQVRTVINHVKVKLKQLPRNPRSIMDNRPPFWDREVQITGYLGEAAVYMYFYGADVGFAMFDEHRQRQNANPYHGDVADIFGDTEIRTSRINRNQRKNVPRSSFNCIVRNYHRSCLRPHFRYIQALTSYPDSLASNYTISNTRVDVYIMGWAYGHEFQYYPNGKGNLKGELWAIPVAQMHGMSKFEVPVEMETIY